MKSKIKSLSRDERRTIIVFEADNQIVRNIEKAFRKLNFDFELQDYKKKYGSSIIENAWELNKKGEDFNFSLVVKKDFVRLGLKGNLGFVNKFLKILDEYTEFSELSSKVKMKLRRRGFKF